MKNIFYLINFLFPGRKCIKKFFFENREKSLTIQSPRPSFRKLLKHEKG